METETTTTEIDRFGNTIDQAGQAWNEHGHPVPEATALKVAEEALSRATEQVRQLSQQLEGSDPRLEEFWRKAQDYAQSVGFCSEFDKIAEHLGGPARSLAWSGYVTTTVTLAVQVPVCGIDSVEAVNDHNVTYEIDTWELRDQAKQAIEDLSHYELDYEIDDASIEITDTEPAEN
jgi:hypothetical protein